MLQAQHHCCPYTALERQLLLFQPASIIRLCIISELLSLIFSNLYRKDSNQCHGAIEQENLLFAPFLLIQKFCVCERMLIEIYM
jgi:hypothetical protein